MREYRTFEHREARFRICSDQFDAATAAIVRLRRELGDYITRQPAFQTNMEPLALLPDAPEIAQRMAHAADAVGVGPMAAVAGAVAQLAAEAAREAGAPETIVDNGGDVYVCATAPVLVGLYAGRDAPTRGFALRVEPEQTPLAACSSSGAMGHSTSLGRCELATVVATDAALADAAATQAANLVKSESDIEPALEAISSIPGIHGVLIVHANRVGLIGQLPKLVRATA